MKTKAGLQIVAVRGWNGRGVALVECVDKTLPPQPGVTFTEHIGRPVVDAQNLPPPLFFVTGRFVAVERGAASGQSTCRHNCNDMELIAPHRKPNETK